MESSATSESIGSRVRIAGQLAELCDVRPGPAHFPMPATRFRCTELTRWADRARSCRSWQAYIDDHLIVPLPSGGQLSSAAIVGSDGGVWAQSDTFPEASEQEVRCAITCCAYQPRRWLKQRKDARLRQLGLA